MVNANCLGATTRPRAHSENALIFTALLAVAGSGLLSPAAQRRLNLIEDLRMLHIRFYFASPVGKLGRRAANDLRMMSYRFAYLAAIVSSVLARPVLAQAARPDPVGTWRGTSACPVRPSACQDESVVYRITRTTTRDSLALDGRKIVNAAEVEMGVLGCRLDASSARLTCPIADGVWLFTVRGDSLVGELRLSDGTKVRDVRTGRSR